MKKASDRPTLVALGKRIAARRRERGATLDWLSQRMSISKGNLSDIERGKRDPRFLTLLAISEGLKTPLDELLVQRGPRSGGSAAKKR
jgi:transcriptional regulator with XRE-family HTH domain